MYGQIPLTVNRWRDRSPILDDVDVRRRWLTLAVCVVVIIAVAAAIAFLSGGFSLTSTVMSI